MNNQDFITFIDECLNHNMTIKKYIPVQESIYKIVEYANTSKGYPMSYINKRIMGKDILGLFKNIVNEKKYDNLDEIVDFVLFLKPSNSFISRLIETIIFKFPFERISRIDYYYAFSCICVDARDIKDEVINYNSNLRIVELIKKYLYYLNLYIANGNIKIRPSILTFDVESQEFHNIAIGVMADIYATDLDINILDKFLYSLYYDHENTMDYLDINGLLKKYGCDYGIKNSIEIIKLFSEKESNNILIK